MFFVRGYICAEKKEKHHKQKREKDGARPRSNYKSMTNADYQFWGARGRMQNLEQTRRVYGELQCTNQVTKQRVNSLVQV